MNAPRITAALAGLVVLSAINAAQAVQNANLVAHYRLDEEFGTVAFDSAGTASDGTWASANEDGLGWGVGLLGGAVVTRGQTDDYFNIGQIPELANTTALTIAVWMNSDDINQGTYKGIFTTRTGLTVANGSEVAGLNWGISEWHTGGAADGRVGNLSVAREVFINNNTTQDELETAVWTHLALTWDGAADVDNGNATGGRAKLYINGVLEADTEVGNGDDSIRDFTQLISADWQIGNDDCCDGTREWDGLLDDIGVWDMALADADIAQIYTQATVPNGSGDVFDLADVRAPILLPGDVDGDEIVELVDDGHVIRDNFGVTIPANTSARKFGDLTGDGVVGLDDFLEWRAEYAGAPLSGFEAIPEPSSVALVVLSLLMASTSRRS